MAKNICLIIFCFIFSCSSLINASIDTKITINYQRNDNNYEYYALWLWGDVKEPSTSWPVGAKSFKSLTDFGAQAKVRLSENAQEINLMVIKKNSGIADAGNKRIVITNETQEVWIRQNDDNIYNCSNFSIRPVVLTSVIDSKSSLVLNFNTTDNIKFNKNDFIIHDVEGQQIELKSIDVISKNAITISAEFDTNKRPFSVKYKSQTLMADLNWQLIDKLYAYHENDLGCTIINDNAQFKLWAPRANNVELLVYDKKDQNILIDEFEMLRGEKGVWHYTLTPEKLERQSVKNHYYQYRVTNPRREPRLVLDPYAKSMAPVTVSPCGSHAGETEDFIGKGAIIDPSSGGPQLTGFEATLPREKAIIYEIHIRDFTSDPSIADQLTHRWGSFMAFTEKLDYIKELGVTHVQLLPVMAWYYGDETQMDERELHYSTRNNSYNWGYDPHNYFSPDGAYSENSADPNLRIKELKTLINKIHEADMGVILDVVYTHMAKASFLDDIVPDYYFFKDPHGNLLGDFGNNLATNRIMAEKLMIDSVKFWFDEYKIDGMRWDMMGDATKDSVQRAFDAAAKINPATIFIGEGWRTFKGHIEDPNLAGMGADQDWMSETDDVGVFSDEFRNELKSGFGSEGEPMFLTGGPRNIKRLFNNIIAQPENTPSTSPGDMVQYIAAHDNMPLYDIIAKSIKKDPCIEKNNKEIHRRIRIGNAMVLTAQGTAFIHAGQEFGRTKQFRAEGKPEHKYHKVFDKDGNPFNYPYFVHDSYDSTDAINMFDWSKATNSQKYYENVKTASFTKGMIKLRKSTDAFTHTSFEDIKKYISLIDVLEIKTDDLAIAWTSKSTDGLKYHTFVNADSKTRIFSLNFDIEDGKIIVDGQTAGTSLISNPKDVTIKPRQVILKPLTITVIKQ